MFDANSMPDDPAGVLELLGARQAAAQQAQTQVLELAVHWAAMHPAESIDCAAVEEFGDKPIPVTGPGAPMVAEFAVMEFAAKLGRSLDSGRTLLGQAVELAHRLPRVWQRVIAGDLAPWKATRIADQTRKLDPHQAEWVDTQVHHFAHKIGPFQLARIVDDAIAMTTLDEEPDTEPASNRDARIDFRNTQRDGTVPMDALLDLADARDLDHALQIGAHNLKAVGAEDDLDARRAMALGEIARHYNATYADTASRTNVTIYAHLSGDAMRTHVGLATVEGVKSTSIDVERILAWCNRPGASVKVQPIIDLDDEVKVDTYAANAQLREQSFVRDGTCIFPYCNRDARHCDLDHQQPWGEGGLTASRNIGPLCRRHHRLKTHGGWRVRGIEAGVYRWRSPHGDHYLVDRSGTQELEEVLGNAGFEARCARTSTSRTVG